jgi:hypothetical protein
MGRGERCRTRHRSGWRRARKSPSPARRPQLSEFPGSKGAPKLLPHLIAFALFCLNAYVCRELFTAGFLSNLSSNEGAFVSIARFFQEHPADWRWFPWFNAGMPIENAYQPLLPVSTAITGTLSGWPIERAFHLVLAIAWCCGPVTLFWFVFDWSESLATGAVAGLLYSLTSPAEWLIPILRVPGGWGSLRLFNLIHYAEDPHIVALTLLPLALLFLRRRNMAAAIIASSAVVLTNAFGAVDLAIGGICIVLASRQGSLRLLATGMAAWLWISPWLTPSLIGQMGRDQWGARGLFHAGAGTWIATIGAMAVFGGLWLVTTRLSSSFDRFAVLFAVPICAIPLGFFLFDLTLVPQANRYQLELEMAVCIAIASVVAQVARHVPRRQAAIAALILFGLCGGIWQTKASRRFARSLIQPISIGQTIQYKTDEWLNRHLPGQRAMISGDVEYLYNVISDNPQMAGGHQPTAPNWVQLFSIFAIYTGQNAGDRDAEISLIWLKAFGNQAVTVPGEKSREAYHPIAHSHKFDGLLPLLWHDEDDTIFAVPQRSSSLAHVVPREAVVAREPIHGLDVEPVRPYVAALDNPALPAANLLWIGPSHARIAADMVAKTQVVSVQENYAPGWRAAVGGRQIPVHKDGIGLITLEPECEGACVIDLWYGVSTEAWICRVLSLLATLLIAALAARQLGVSRTSRQYA